jgi:hypothetical protein
VCFKIIGFKYSPTVRCTFVFEYAFGIICHGVEVVVHAKLFSYLLYLMLEKSI